ncbi:hypothetical protein MKEN_00986300 [Mycena kentingensis (nom. inval.)]|nr:hypothetical protein MKEN_00986300 [Mycena kentingensis (nom. inval.)]
MDPIDLVATWRYDDINNWSNISHLAFQVVFNATDRASRDARRPHASLEENAWRSVPYILRRRVHGMADRPAGLGDIDEWVRDFESRLNLIEDPPRSDYLGLVNLDDVHIIFPQIDDATGMRVLPRPSNANNLTGGYRVFDEGRPSKLLVQACNSDFSTAFQRVTGGALSGLDWSGIFVAGGIVLQALLDIEGSPSAFGPDSDIDLFMYDVEPCVANAKVRHVYEMFRRNLPAGYPVFVVRNTRTITLYSRFPVRRVQIVLRLASLLREVPMNFDLDVCGIAWDGAVVWLTPRALRALETGYNCFRVDLLGGRFRLKRFGSSMPRVVKYADRGFGFNILAADVGSPLVLANIQRVAQKARDYVAAKVSARNSEAPVAMAFRELGTGPPLMSFLSFMKHETLWALSRQGVVRLQPAPPVEEVHTAAYVPITLAWGATVSFDRLAVDAAALNEKRNNTSYDGVMHLLDAFYDGRRNITRNALVSAAVFGTQSVLFGDNIDSVVGYRAELTRVVMLPISLATFFNDTITRVQVAKNLRIVTTFVPVHSDEQWWSMSSPRRLRPYTWSIPSDMMWDNTDATLDAVYRIAGVFYAMTQRSDAGEDELSPRWVMTHLVKPSGSEPACLREDYFRGWIRRADDDRNDLHYTPAEESHRGSARSS